jgi:hypothetical protein
VLSLHALWMFKFRANDKASKFLLNTGMQPIYYMVQQPRITPSIFIQPSKPKILQVKLQFCIF